MACTTHLSYCSYEDIFFFRVIWSLSVSPVGLSYGFANNLKYLRLDIQVYDQHVQGLPKGSWYGVILRSAKGRMTVSYINFFFCLQIKPALWCVFSTQLSIISRWSSGRAGLALRVHTLEILGIHRPLSDTIQIHRELIKGRLVRRTRVWLGTPKEENGEQKSKREIWIGELTARA